LKDGRAGVGRTLLDRNSPPTPLTADYHPTLLYVACTKCRSVGNVDFPRGFDYKTGDRIMDGRVFKGFCLLCRSMTEMRPLNDMELFKNRYQILRRHYETLLLWRSKMLLNPYEEEFIRQYEKKYGAGGYPPGFDVPVVNERVTSPADETNLVDALRKIIVSVPENISEEKPCQTPSPFNTIPAAPPASPSPPAPPAVTEGPPGA
jgi:hypothetical protein